MWKFIDKWATAFFFPLVALFVAAVQVLSGSTASLTTESGVVIEGFLLFFIYNLFTISALIGSIFIIAMAYITITQYDKGN